ncbi:Biopolymer transport protein ExbD/TolR [Phycisphaerae bacterium RAS1]|nr:Biopolymer transport protein ExbD/TolR [Phycisphaerae bacterium RAS1]
MRRHLTPTGDNVPNLAPMVDVIMVLLVFFLLGASFELVREGLLKTELDPASGPGGGAMVEINPRVRIALLDAGAAAVTIMLMDEQIAGGDFERLHAALQEKRLSGADTENPVVIGADPTVRWQFVIKAMDATVRAGFKNVQFAVSFRPGAVGGAGAGP